MYDRATSKEMLAAELLYWVMHTIKKCELYTYIKFDFQVANMKARVVQPVPVTKECERDTEYPPRAREQTLYINQGHTHYLLDYTKAVHLHKLRV